MTEAFQGLLPESQLPRGFAATKTTRNSYHVLLHAPTHWQVEAVGGGCAFGFCLLRLLLLFGLCPWFLGIPC